MIKFIIFLIMTYFALSLVTPFIFIGALILIMYVIYKLARLL